ncbi:Manganese transporter SMF1 [Cytospora mali]|uniref:Manganese transporter SMF1 n=1 Tax=Cytospora mali TaxID=578113 RepID=A0A194UPK7_CYTMA|nr:Manganese transporter SMF1 [Valsa mali var. pyri (nom. inval.)]
MEDPSIPSTAKGASSRATAPSSLDPVETSLRQRSSPSSSQGQDHEQLSQRESGRESSLGDETAGINPALPSRTLAATGSDGSNDFHHRFGRKSAPGQGLGVEAAPSSSEALQRNASQVAVKEKPPSPPTPPAPLNDPEDGSESPTFTSQIRHAVLTFGKFVGPGFMIAVAYIDPGNYSTDIAAGATYRFRLLFIVLLSNLFAIFLQSLCIKLGTVTGLNLAEACRAFLPRWLNYALYALAEIAIIATDLAEVIGTAIAINLLIPQIPLVAGCAISIVDVLIILLFYNPSGSMRGLRAFESFVVLLVLAVVVCFCIQMSLIHNTTVGEVFRGYLPSSAIIQQEGLYQSCGILGATVMPHSLYLGSGIVQPRLKEYDMKKGLMPIGNSDSSTNEGTEKSVYIPSLTAIQHCMKYSIGELAISLFTFALFINSAILIIAGSSLYGSEEAEGADIFAIHALLSRSLGRGAGILFALALLLSGISAGIVCTIAGQMVSEGAINWHIRPWLRRLMTRSMSIIPSIIVAGAVGREGLDTALNASQVVLSVVLPFVSAPLIYFTCMNKYMKVRPGRARFIDYDDDNEEATHNETRMANLGLTSVVSSVSGPSAENVKMANSVPVVIIALLVWLVMAAMNVANLVLLGMGKE